VTGPREAAMKAAQKVVTPDRGPSLKGSGGKADTAGLPERAVATATGPKSVQKAVTPDRGPSLKESGGKADTTGLPEKGLREAATATGQREAAMKAAQKAASQTRERGS